uniref:EGF domain-specific O-linked N-acetylglucosamine transferase n=1 Tax=Amphimedon queenslandica TaxID=400682 RepID=A0A1X7VWI0_AMPQE
MVVVAMRLLPFRLSGVARLILYLACFSVFIVISFGVFVFHVSSTPSDDNTWKRVRQELPLSLSSPSGSLSSSSPLVKALTFNETTAPSTPSSPSLTTVVSSLFASSLSSSLPPSSIYLKGLQNFSQSEVNPVNSWPEGEFCDQFLSNKFPVHFSVCSDNDRIQCSGTTLDDKMGSCTTKRVAINIPEFYKVMKTKRDSVENSNTMWLVQDNEDSIPCPKYDFKLLDKHMFGGDYLKRLAKTSVLSHSQSECQGWINGTTFLFVGFDVHIYFKFLSWFSLYNGILNDSPSNRPPSLILRIPETRGNFLFPEFEHDLFPETNVYGLSELAAENVGTLCFERIVTTPWAFGTTAFRCKMADAIVKLRKKCYSCNSRDLPGARYRQFRKRVLRACSLTDDPVPYTEKTPRRIVLQIRKPYSRFEGEAATKISRILENSNKLAEALRAGFPKANVTVMHGEDLGLCEQISLVHKADVLMGVHGAGLVHSWWLQDHALLFELVPRSQLSNPTFKMLTTLSGRRYYSYTSVKGGDKRVTVDEQDIVKRLKSEY